MSRVVGRLFSTSSTTKSFPWFKITSSILVAGTALVGGSGYAALHIPAFQKVYKENVPYATEIMSLVSSFETKAQNTSLKELQNDVSSAAIKVGETVNDAIIKSSKTIESSRASVEKTLETTKKYANETATSVEQVWKTVEKEWDKNAKKAQEIGESAKKTWNQVAENVNQVAEKTKELANDIEETIRKPKGVASKTTPANPAVEKPLKEPTPLATPVDESKDAPVAVAAEPALEVVETPAVSAVEAETIPLAASVVDQKEETEIIVEPKVEAVDIPLTRIIVHESSAASVDSASNPVVVSTEVDTVKLVSERIQQLKLDPSLASDEQIAKLVDDLLSVAPKVQQMIDLNLAKEQWFKEQEQKFADQVENQVAVHKSELDKEFHAALADAIQRQLYELEQITLSRIETLESELNQSFNLKLEKEIRDQTIARLENLESLQYRLDSIEKITNSALDVVGKDAFILKMVATVDGLKESFNRNATFDKELRVLDRLNSQNPSEFVTEMIENLKKNRKVSSIYELEQAFGSVSESIRAVQFMPDDGGPFSMAISWLASKLMFHKKGFVRGEDIESTLARSEYYLGLGDLDQAARELNQIKEEWPKTFAEDWLVPVRSYLEVKQAIELLDAHATLLALKKL